MAKELEAAFPNTVTLRVVPNGVNVQLCAPRITEALKRHHISIVYVGRLGRKGINVLAEALISKSISPEAFVVGTVMNQT